MGHAFGAAALLFTILDAFGHQHNRRSFLTAPRSAATGTAATTAPRAAAISTPVTATVATAATPAAATTSASAILVFSGLRAGCNWLGRLKFAHLVRENLAFIDPDLHPDPAVGGMRMNLCVVDVGAQGMSRHPA